LKGTKPLRPGAVRHRYCPKSNHKKSNLPSYKRKSITESPTHPSITSLEKTSKSDPADIFATAPTTQKAISAARRTVIQLSNTIGHRRNAEKPEATAVIETP
jgi:hypothetical protein